MTEACDKKETKGASKFHLDNIKQIAKELKAKESKIEQSSTNELGMANEV